MRFRTKAEADEFFKQLLAAKEAGKREYLTARLDSVPQWQGKGTPKPKLDGSDIELVYLSYLPATEKQKEQAEGAKLAGVKLERISGKLVDIRQCQDGTIQVLFTNGLRDGQGEIPWRSINTNKGILCYLAVNEGLGEPVEEIIARIPAEMLAALKAGKEAKLSRTKAKVKAAVAVAAGPAKQVQPKPQSDSSIDVPVDGEVRKKLK
jgi:hypothetical protein